MEECTFNPHREGAKTSEKYLSRMGRTTATPEDFFNFHKVRSVPSASPLCSSESGKNPSK
jgi:hypothetical protein